MLQNKLQSDVARAFTIHAQTCFATNQVVAGCQELLQKVTVVLLLVTKSVHVARFSAPLQTCLAAGDVTPVYGVTFKSFNPIRSQYSRSLQQPLFKRATLLFNTFCINVAKQVARFCCPIYRTLKSAAHSLKVTLVFGTSSTSRYNALCFPLSFLSPSPRLSLKLNTSIDFNLSMGRQFVQERRNVISC